MSRLETLEIKNGQDLVKCWTLEGAEGGGM